MSKQAIQVAVCSQLWCFKFVLLAWQAPSLDRYVLSWCLQFTPASLDATAHFCEALQHIAYHCFLAWISLWFRMVLGHVRCKSHVLECLDHDIEEIKQWMFGIQCEDGISSSPACWSKRHHALAPPGDSAALETQMWFLIHFDALFVKSILGQCLGADRIKGWKLTNALKTSN